MQSSSLEIAEVQPVLVFKDKGTTFFKGGLEITGVIQHYSSLIHLRFYTWPRLLLKAVDVDVKLIAHPGHDVRRDDSPAWGIAHGSKRVLMGFQPIAERLYAYAGTTGHLGFRHCLHKPINIKQ